MIRVDAIAVKEFRGIRDLSCTLKGKSFAICGPNGTGKSGIVDALEFVLTGNVSRLSGEGRGEVSLKDHGAHVDSRDDPGRAQVSVALTIPSLGRAAMVTRTVKRARTPVVEPDDPDIRAVLGEIESHPEFVLSRRELIKYVLATPGKRAEEVQVLLRLDEIERVRTGLLKLANASERRLKELTSAAARHRENLNCALGISELTKDKVLAAANAKRTILDLPPLGDLTENNSLKEGVTGPAGGQPVRVSKAHAQSAADRVREELDRLGGAESAALVGEVKKALEEFSQDPWAATGLVRREFYARGLDLIDAPSCPYCDTAWDVEALKAHVQEKLAHLDDLVHKRVEVDAKLAPLIERLEQTKEETAVLVRQAGALVAPLSLQGLRKYGAAIERWVKAMKALLPLDGIRPALESLTIVPKEVADGMNAIATAVAALPDLSKQDAARDWLAAAQERLDVYRDARRQQRGAQEQAARARKLSDLFMNVSDKELGAIYERVQGEFASLYAAINSEDEGTFTAKLVPSMGKLGFNVDFYGRGFFPPGAYHSEGHQDGMGLCLYLALMRHLQGDAFTFAVLDDVLMSVDSGHRRKVSEVLRREFPNTQFVLTTHDPIWLRHMKTERLIEEGASVQFRNWSVDYGPAQWEGRDVWAEIEEYVSKNDIRSAAALLRQYLEHVSAELCHRLRAPVEYRGDAQYQLGDLLPAAVARMKDLFGKAKDAANSWNQREEMAGIEGRADAFKALVEASRVEQWQINAAIHYNEWDNLSPADFRPVAVSFTNLIGGFGCPECTHFLRVIPNRLTMETVQCACSKTAMNLKKKR